VKIAIFDSQESLQELARFCAQVVHYHGPGTDVRVAVVTEGLAYSVNGGTWTPAGGQAKMESDVDEAFCPIWAPLPGDPATATCAEQGCGHYREDHGGQGGRCTLGRQKSTASWRCECRHFVEPPAS
jgi:hypothetical protein